MKNYLTPILHGGFIFFFLLTFVGLSILVLGLLVNETVFAIAGGVFILMTAIGLRHTLPFKVLVGTLIGAFLGALAGALVGLLVGNVAEWLVGIVGGIILGAISGGVLLMVLMAPLFSFGAGGIGIVPRPVVSILFVLGMILGIFFGVTGLRETLMSIFGPVGGGAIVGGVLGMIGGGVLAGAAEKRNIEMPR